MKALIKDIKTNPVLGYTKLMIDCDLVTWENELSRIKKEHKREPEHYSTAYYEGIVDGIKIALENFAE